MPTATEAYLNVLETVLQDGVPVGTANHGDSIEVINNSCSFDMHYPFVGSLARDLNYRYPCAEARWVIAGSNRLDYSDSVGKTLLPWSDNGSRMNGGYGPKFCDQLPYIIDLLNAKPTSRQAVISLWQSSPRASKDTPCTTQMQFLIRDNVFHCIVNMRSSDSWLGLPNDMAVFTLMAANVMLELQAQLSLGMMHINLGSSHIYMKDMTACGNILADPKIKESKKFDFDTWSYADFIHWLSELQVMSKDAAREAVLV